MFHTIRQRRSRRLPEKSARPWCTRLFAVALLIVFAGGCNDSDDSPAASNPARAETRTSTGSFGTADAGKIRPGVEIRSDYGSCTANFLFRLNAETYYLGTAAHCFSADASRGIDPCEAHTEGPGFGEITIENARQPGTLAYSSWDAMQRDAETPGSVACRFNDFALVRLHPDDVDNIHPSAAHYGGPVSLLEGLAQPGDTAYSYGRSVFHAGVEELEKRDGEVVEIRGDGWAYRLQSDTPGVPGDSGGPVLHETGAAMGALTDITLAVGPAPVTNGAVNLNRALTYGKAHGFIHADVTLVTSADFSP